MITSIILILNKIIIIVIKFEKQILFISKKNHRFDLIIKGKIIIIIIIIKFEKKLLLLKKNHRFDLKGKINNNDDDDNNTNDNN
jgi:hypothetical protein